MRKLTSTEEGKLLELVFAFAEDYAYFVLFPPMGVKSMDELVMSENLGNAITTYVESLL